MNQSLCSARVLPRARSDRRARDPLADTIGRPCAPLLVAVLALCLTPWSPGFAQAGFDIKSRLSVQTPSDPVLAKARIDSVFLASTTVLWGTSAGLFIERPDGTGTWWNAGNAPFKLEEFVAVAARAPNELWVAVRNPAAGQGLFLYDGTRWQRFHPSLNEMLSELTNCLLVDARNRLWVGYEERGIDRFIGEGYGTKTLRLFGGLKVKDGLLPGSVNSLAESGGRIWVGSTSGLCRFDPDSEHKTSFESWTFERGFPDHAVWAVIPYGNGRVACGTDQGFVVPDGEGWKLIGRADGLATVPVKAIATERGRLWVGHNEGLQVYENGRLSALLYTPDLLPAQPVRCLAARELPDGTSRLFVGTEAGARVFTVR
ncbi:MAG: histidine kinase/response regulator hybrid protein [Candidatus Ozemobacter sibiricus]|jgi:ligand-binding sensor domain-containing protein|uniref:Histidine kinase/response regulator hybrid protein n=1 Tax=Candidatus Ozemobacter sibiricus TaxID=2268124 RepID=A0A367ZUE6_9BACT|nr:MAG: histidine kinase/response regulator hybrid protein [Candidatus Ozemobacter sibiricus]